MCAAGAAAALCQGLEHAGVAHSARAVRSLFASSSGDGSGSSGGGGSSEDAAPLRSMLDASLPHPGGAGAALGSAAAARLRALQEAEPQDGTTASAGTGTVGGAASAGGAAAAAAAAGGRSARGGVRRLAGWLLDSAMVAGLAAVLAGGYTYATCSLDDVAAAVAVARAAPEPGPLDRLKSLTGDAYLRVMTPIDRKARCCCGVVVVATHTLSAVC